MNEEYELVHIGLILNPVRHIDENTFKTDYVVVQGKNSDAYAAARELAKQEFPGAVAKQEPQLYKREALTRISTLEGKLFRVVLQDVAELPEEEKLPIDKASPEERKKAYFDRVGNGRELFDLGFKR